ncbi:MAG: hypothetical protein MUQ10_00915, partial [Anaerolineae bacterium]|nr:hypothetical protein [Anaerolineae bacterium]
MKMTKLVGVYLAIVALVASSLACNAPPRAPAARESSVTPTVAPSESEDSDSTIPKPADESEPEEQEEAEEETEQSPAAEP